METRLTRKTYVLTTSELSTLGLPRDERITKVSLVEGNIEIETVKGDINDKERLEHKGGYRP